MKVAAIPGGILDAYLKIAELVLRSERRPLGPRAILSAAYRLGLVPQHLHGQTQHKTLQARLSEELVARRDKSTFFRSEPGKFFLREFLKDASLPEKWRQPVHTQRRIRELLRGPALALDIADLRSIASDDGTVQPEHIYELLRTERYHYDDPKHPHEGSVFVWSFVSVWRDRQILTYRLGRYRDDRDTFMSKRCLGFSTLVHESERGLFTLRDFGIVGAGVRATKMDLDVPETAEEAEPPKEGNLCNFLLVTRSEGETDLLALVDFDCPKWFEPTRRRLAINELSWMSVGTPVNNHDDFDPWSRSVLMKRYIHCASDWHD